MHAPAFGMGDQKPFQKHYFASTSENQSQQLHFSQSSIPNKIYHKFYDSTRRYTSGFIFPPFRVFGKLPRILCVCVPRTPEIYSRVHANRLQKNHEISVLHPVYAPHFPPESCDLYPLFFMVVTFQDKRPVLPKLHRL